MISGSVTIKLKKFDSYAAFLPYFVLKSEWGFFIPIFKYWQCYIAKYP